MLNEPALTDREKLHGRLIAATAKLADSTTYEDTASRRSEWKRIYRQVGGLLNEMAPIAE